MIPANRTPGALVDPAGQLEGGRPRDHPGPVHPDVDVDDHRDVDARRRPDLRGEVDVERVVGADHDLGPVLEPGGALELDPRRERVGDEDARDAALDHDLRLGDLGAGDADRPEVHLAAGDPRRLVALRVGPPGLAAGRDRGRQPVRRCASNRPRSSRRDGVSSSAFGRPMRGSVAAALVVATGLPAGRDGAGTVRPGERHCRLSTIAAHGDHDGGRRLGRVLGRANGAGQRALGLVHAAVALADGTVLATCRLGTDREGADGHVGVFASTDGGDDWELRFLGLRRTGLGRLAGRGARLVRRRSWSRASSSRRCCGPIARTRATRGSTR